MEIQKPKSMSELVYYTRRTLSDGSKIETWVPRIPCPTCGVLTGKPKDSKTGKPKIRATEYICDNGHEIPGKEYEAQLFANAEYTCKCGHHSLTQIPYKRKKIKIPGEDGGKDKSADALVFECEKCKNKLPVTKKLK